MMIQPLKWNCNLQLIVMYSYKIIKDTLFLDLIMHEGGCTIGCIFRYLMNKAHDIKKTTCYSAYSITTNKNLIFKN